MGTHELICRAVYNLEIAKSGPNKTTNEHRIDLLKHINKNFKEFLTGFMKPKLTAVQQNNPHAFGGKWWMEASSDKVSSSSKISWNFEPPELLGWGWECNILEKGTKWIWSSREGRESGLAQEEMGCLGAACFA